MIASSIILRRPRSGNDVISNTIDVRASEAAGKSDIQSIGPVPILRLARPASLDGSRDEMAATEREDIKKR